CDVLLLNPDLYRHYPVPLSGRRDRSSNRDSGSPGPVVRISPAERRDGIPSRSYLSSMTESSNDTLANRISRSLADRITAGEFAAGARLRQDHIAEEFGASHVPVREAFRRLEAQGLVVSEPRRGVR